MNSNSLQSLASEIEAGIQQRNSVRVVEKILAKYLATLKKIKNPSSSVKIETIARVCDWHRRMGLFEKGYQWVVPRGQITQRASTDTVDGTRLLWTARFLSWMGAPVLAWRLLSVIEPRSEIDHRIVAGLYLENFQYLKAWEHTEKMIALNQNATDYRFRVSLLNGSDALCGLQRYQDAVRIASQVFQKSKEPLLKAMAQSALGQYYLLSGDLRRAQNALELAENFFPKTDQHSLDRAILQRWQGELLLRTGHLKSGSKSLRISAETFKKSGARPEAYLKVIEAIASYRLTTPQEEKLLHEYPALSDFFFERVKRRSQEIPVNPNAILWIDLHREEVHTRESPRKNFHASIFLALEVKALAFISLSGNLGISRMRLGSLLWPDQPFSVTSFAERIRKLLGRIHKIYGIKVVEIDKKLNLPEKFKDKIHVTPVLSNPDRRPSFFIHSPNAFQADLIGKYYRLSRAQQFRVLAQWRERKYCP